MNYWSVKQIADMLGITIQAIYKNKDEYIQKGYLEKDQDGKYVFNLNGYNYLINKHNGVKTTEPKNTHSDPIQYEYIEMLKRNIEQLQKENQELKEKHTKELNQERERTSYFMRLFEQKEQLLNQYMLPPGEPGERTQRKSIWSKLFHT